MEEAVDDVITIDLGTGKTYPLIFPIEAIRKAKKKYGGLTKMLNADSDESLPELAAAGIVDPDITEEWIVKNVSFSRLSHEQGKIIAAFTGKTKSEYEAELAEKKAEAAAKKAQTQPAP